MVEVLRSDAESLGSGIEKIDGMVRVHHHSRQERCRCRLNQASSVEQNRAMSLSRLGEIALQGKFITLLSRIQQ